MAVYFPEMIAQQQMLNSATNAFTKNPQFEGLVRKVCKMFGVEFNTMSDVEKQVIYGVAMALLNTPLGALAGTDNGADIFSSIHRGVTSAPMPFVTTQHPMFNGGVGSGRAFIGNSYGTGFNSTAIAAQLQAQFNRAVYNPDGSHNTTFTNGLDANIIAQVFAKKLEERGWHAGDVVMADFGDTAAQMAAEAERLVAAGVISEGGGAHKHMMQVVAAREKADKIRSETGKSYDEVLAVMANAKDKETGKHVWDRRILDDVRVQIRGSLHGSIIDEDVGKSVLKSVGLLTENLKTLADLTGHTTLDDLQDAADALRLGSLTQAENVRKVDARIRQWKIQSQMTNRDIKEIMLEQKDIATALAPLYGGRDYVPQAEIENIQQIRYDGNKAYENGDSYVTGDIKAQAAARTGLSIRERYVGVMKAQYLLSKYGNTLTEQERAGLQAKVDAYQAAVAAGNSDMMYKASQEAGALAYQTRSFTGDEAFAKAAQANSDLDVTQDAYRSNALANSQFYLSKFIQGQRHVAGSSWDRVRNASGDDERGTLLSRFMANDILYSGGDTARRNEVQAMLAKAAAGNTSEIDAYIESQGSEAAKVQLRSMLAYAKRFTNADDFNAAMGISNAGINNNVNTANLIGTSKLVDQARQRFVEINKEMDVADQAAASKGGTAFVNGLLSKGGLTDREAVLGSVAKMSAERGGKLTDAQLSELLANNFGGSLLGKVDASGKFADPDQLLKNDQVREILGIKKGREGDKAAADIALKMKGDEVFHSRIMEALNASGRIGKVDGRMFIMERGAGRKWFEARKAAFDEHEGQHLVSIYGEGNVDWRIQDGKYVPVIRGADGRWGAPDTIQEELVNAWKNGEWDQRERIIKAADTGSKQAQEAMKTVYAGIATTLNDEKLKENLLLSGDEAKDIHVNELIESARKGDRAALAELGKLVGSSNALRSLSDAREAGLIDKETGKWVRGKFKGEVATKQHVEAMRGIGADVRKQLDAINGSGDNREVSEKILGLLKDITEGRGDIVVRMQ